MAMCRALPDGVVTLLFPDIEGSTRLLRKLGDGYGDALDDHRRIVRAACAAHEGVEVDTQGDAFSTPSIQMRLQIPSTRRPYLTAGHGSMSDTIGISRAETAMKVMKMGVTSEA
jgi:class 3 adenylate cyclase